MRHRLQQKVFDRKKYNTDKSVIPSSIQESRTPSTFTTSYNSKNPHLTKKNKLHSKSTYFYRWGSSSKLSSSLSYVVPSVCGLALLVGGIIAINPIFNNIEQANAWSATSSDGSITLTIPDTDMNQNATTAQAGEIAYRSYAFTIGGTTPQYAVTLNAANGYTGELKGQQYPDAVIGKVEPGTTVANFANNTWGYAVTPRNATSTDNSTLTYNPVPKPQPAEPAILASRSGLSGTINDSYRLVFAAKLGPDNPSDHYQTLVYLSAISNATEIAGLGFVGDNGKITEMQQMTSSICSGAAVGTTAQLKDSRDGKLYWVTKLKDENCWMTQNLDFDVPAQLSNTSSNVGSATVNTGTTKVTSISSWPSSGNTYNGYYDLESYVYNGPDNNHSQGVNCTNATGLKDCEQFSKVTADSDLHYHVGNLYSWNAATAGTGGSITSGQASGSICPKGWKLPTSSNNNNGSFGWLLTQYGVQSNLTGTVDGKSTAIYGEPLYFVYGGYLNGGKLSNAGNLGYYWSSTPYSNAANAYSLSFVSGVNPSYDYSARYFGISVRCVAQ